MSERTIHFKVDLAINEGKLEDFQKIARDMTALTESEPGAVQYDWYFNGDGKRCVLLETYADQGAMLAHMAGRAVRELVPALLRTSEIRSFEVFGDPGAEGGEMLAKLGAEIFRFSQGIRR